QDVSAVISADSTLYTFSSVNDCLMAIKDDQVLWTEEFNSQYDMNIVIDSEGILYLPVIFDGYHRLVSFDPKARIILWYSEQGWGTGTRNVILAPDSILYVTFYDTSFRAINKTDGKTLWTYDLPEGKVGRTSYGSDGWLYFISYQNTYYGKLTKSDSKSSQSIGNYYEPSRELAIDKEGTIYFASVGTSSDTLFAYNPNLSLKWKEALDDTTWIKCPPAICPDGSIVVGSEGGYVHKVSKEGQYQWKSEKLGTGLYLPTVDAEGKIFISSETDTIYCLNSSGQRQYSLYTLYWGQCLIGPGRRLFVVSQTAITCYNDKNSYKESKIIKESIPCKLNVSPNPFRDKLNIKSNMSVIIYSLTGQLIREIEKGDNIINTRNWKEGVYIIKSGKECKKVVKIN
ncbi:MAG: PQQ-binding-like beta-propeller repeat protein, partial [Candidatus Coatesbacteria bacterium]|nr:PQQ-binding-like beta-propeller repeat protein [Candidatus Coatesbacteria bacterium]